jgi:LysM repeat protein
VVREGDTLSRIAARWYPDRPDSGLRRILAANPQVTDRDRIHPGQRLILPGLDSPNQGIQLRDKKYYASYGRYGTLEALNEAMAWLIQNKVRYLVVNTVSSDGVSDQEIVLGGYETSADLEKALELVKSKAE